jgi:hypothetical protein
MMCASLRIQLDDLVVVPLEIADNVWARTARVADRQNSIESLVVTGETTYDVFGLDQL